MKLKRLMWNERYLEMMALILVYTLVPLLFRIWESRGNGILYTFTAFEEAFVLSVNSRDYYMPFAYASPLVAAVVCGNLYLDDLAAGGNSLLCVRESKARYHADNLLAIAVSCFLLFLIPLFLNLIVSMLGFPLRDSMMGNGALATTAYHNPYRDIGDEFSFFILLREHHPWLHISLRLLANAMLFTSFAVLNYGLSVLVPFRKYICNLLVEMTYVVLILCMNHFANRFSFVSYLLADESMDSFICLAFVIVGITALGLLFLTIGTRRTA